MREIVLDTETTGLSPDKGDRVVEIGCVELINHVPTSNTFQVYLNPEREMDEGAQRIHGLTNEFLQDKPKFEAIVEDFISYIGESKIIAHNASFDINFLNSELSRLNKAKISQERVIDTLQLLPRLNAISSGNKNLRIYVRGDKNVPYGIVLDTIAKIKSSGFKKVALVAKLKEGWGHD